MAKIVIPGGSGYLGQALAEVLVERGDTILGEHRFHLESGRVKW
jgi:nucleoside-diphosphate-sugar epimerase